LATNQHDSSISYRTNSVREQLVLRYIEHFRCQYHHIYPDRKPLFLHPNNEYGIPVSNISIH
jgi:hypothetical protein